MSVKKAELHVHLEGTISPALAQKLAHRNHITLPDNLIAADGETYQFGDFLHFLKVYDLVADVIKVPQDYYDVTYDYLRACAAENTIYVEMMYSPDHAENASGIPSIEHLHAIQQAINDAEANLDIIGRIIITAVRHYGVDSAIRVAKQAVLQSVPAVVGFGKGGDEVNFPPKQFSRAFEIASEAGLHCTVHAGEHASAEGMLEAIHYLPIERIGHGVRAIESPETMSILKERGIALELCPSSNIRLGIYKNFAEHPFPQFLDAGIKLSLNSDDPPFMGTTVGKEYERVQQAYGYNEQTMKHITGLAIESAFVDEATKQKLQTKLNQS